MGDQPNSTQILALLSAKHSKDLFVPECKDGSTWSASRTARMDAWAMRRSWTRWTTWGYEIKTSRSDFVQDEKWQEYLPLCHRFSFVCPYHMIEPEELQQDVGLLWVTKTGTRLHTKRKAAERQIEAPLNLLIYILMSRAVIVSDMWEANEGTSRERNRNYWRNWLQQKEEDQLLGARVRTRMSELILDLQRRTEKAERRANETEEARRIIEEMLGCPIGKTHYDREGEIRRRLAGLPANLGYALRRAHTEIGAALECIERLEKEPTDDLSIRRREAF